MNRPIFLGSAMLLAFLFVSPQARAGECWAPTRESQRTGTGEPRSDARFDRLNAALRKAEAMLREDPALNAIPGLRFQAHPTLTYIDNERPTYTASVRVTLHEPDVWSGPGCALKQADADYFNKYAVEVKFNDLSDLFGNAGAQGEPGEPMIANMQPDDIAFYRETGIIRTVGQGVRAFRPDGGPILVPLTVGEYLALWEGRLEAMTREGAGEFSEPQLQALRAHRAALSPDRMQAQVWMDGSYSDQLWAYAAEETELGAPVFQIDPGLLQAFADRTAVNLVTIAWYGPDGDPVTEALAGWARRFDAARARAFFKGDTQ